MASVHERPDRKKRWEVKWRDPETGKMRSQSFTGKREALRHGTKMESAKLSGTYIDPAAGNVTFMTYAENGAGAKYTAPRRLARSATTSIATSTPASGTGRSPHYVRA